MKKSHTEKNNTQTHLEFLYQQTYENENIYRNKAKKIREKMNAD